MTNNHLSSTHCVITLRHIKHLAALAVYKKKEMIASRIVTELQHTGIITLGLVYQNLITEPISVNNIIV